MPPRTGTLPSPPPPLTFEYADSSNDFHAIDGRNTFLVADFSISGALLWYSKHLTSCLGKSAVEVLLKITAIR